MPDSQIFVHASQLVTFMGHVFYIIAMTIKFDDHGIFLKIIDTNKGYRLLVDTNKAYRLLVDTNKAYRLLVDTA